MKTVLVTGASGLVGTAICDYLGRRGHEVRTLSRRRGDFTWDVEAGRLDFAAFEGVDAVIHLAGENVAQRWTASAKRRIRESRIAGTRLLAQEILRMDARPVFISASGINYYGFEQTDKVDESSSLGEGFLAEVCRDWEAAAQPLVDAGARCVCVRTGVVLSLKGGAIAKLLPPFRAGVGGVVGSGEQRMSWITLDDLVAVFATCLEDSRYHGPINAVSPGAVTNREFTRSLAQVIRRPAIFPLPAPIATLIFGSMAKETILSDLEVEPRRLMDLGFEWTSPDLIAALEGLFCDEPN